MTDAYTATLAADTIRESSLYNKDLAPVSPERRTWRTYNYAALWISMSVNIPTYMLASGMIAGGMNWKQALFTVFLGNVLVLIPMLLNAHAGARYGIPFPVFARASFGVLGANVPAILRALVACGWFGIQTWIGGQAINAMIVALAPGWANFHSGPAVCFFFFWLLNVLVILRGIETIRFLQGISAPFLLFIGLALLLWARSKAGGFGPMLATPSKFQTFGEFFRFFIPSLTGVVGFWATVSLNIPDFTRYARSQRDQIVGQALGLPATMTFYSFLGTIAGVLICDYFVVRKKVLTVEDLYQRHGQYEYARGFNWTAVAALAAGAALAFVGLVYSPLRILYNYAWFVGFLVSFLTYFALMNRVAPVTQPAD